MGRQFAAAVPRQRLHDSVGQPSYPPGDSACDGVGPLTRQPDEHHVARLTFDERRDECAPRTFKKVALPMARHRAIIDFCGPLSNRNGVENLPLPRGPSRAAARVSKMVLTAQLLEEAALQKIGRASCRERV